MTMQYVRYCFDNVSSRLEVPQQMITSTCIQNQVAASIRVCGRGPRVVVSTAAFHARVRGSVPGIGGLKGTTENQGSNFESCVWRTVSSQSSHHPQEVLLAQFSLYTCTQRWPKARFILFHFISGMYGIPSAKPYFCLL